MIKYLVEVMFLNDDGNIKNTCVTGNVMSKYPAVTSEDYINIVNALLSYYDRTIESQCITELHIKAIDII